MATLWLEPVRRGRHHVVLRYGVDELSFTTTYWYDDVDFSHLAAVYGEEFLRRVEFHLLLFEANKAASLAPDEIDFGPYADLLTEPLWELWETLFRHVWGVWRYENNLPDYRLPRPAGRLSVGAGPPVTVVDPCERLLLLCGGGKDSLACMRLLERGGIAYDTFAYSHSTYGSAAFQHELIGGLVAQCAPHAQHRGWVFDDALDAPIAETHPERGIVRIVAAETVSSYWTALPVALQQGFTEVALGVTRSTDEHNLVWDATGERINYLWGMSSDAERLLYDYIRQHLISDLSMFHLLRSVYDLNVFSMLRDRPRRGAEYAFVRSAETVVLPLREMHLRLDELRRLAPRRDCLQNVSSQPLRDPREPVAPPQDARPRELQADRLRRHSQRGSTCLLDVSRKGCRRRHRR